MAQGTDARQAGDQHGALARQVARQRRFLNAPPARSAPALLGRVSTPTYVSRAALRCWLRVRGTRPRRVRARPGAGAVKGRQR
jgi:hypothetical protein